MLSLSSDLEGKVSGAKEGTGTMNDSQEKKNCSQVTWPVTWSSALHGRANATLKANARGFSAHVGPRVQGILGAFFADAADTNCHTVNIECRGQTAPHGPAKTAVVLEQPPSQVFHVPPTDLPGLKKKAHIGSLF